MTRRQLSQVLVDNGQPAIPVDGYNYAVYSIHTSNPDALAEYLRENKDRIEQEYSQLTGQPAIVLLPFVALKRKRSILLPIPFDASLNGISDVLDRINIPVDISIPMWT